MKLNPDCIRDILIATSESLFPDEMGYVSPISPEDIAELLLPDYQKNEVMYWIRKLMEEEILVKGKKYVSDPLPCIKDLSLSGYRFIEETSDSSKWEKIKSTLLTTAFSSIFSLIQKAIEIGISTLS